jgi:hypothetical protein
MSTFTPPNRVKFEDERSVWQIMLASVREALGRFNVVPSLDFGPESAVEIPLSLATPLLHRAADRV